MSSTRQDNGQELAVAIPRAWQAFLRSGRYAGARASIHAGGSELPVDVVARLEFLDERRLAIHLALADDAPHPANGSGENPAESLTARERAVITLIATGDETPEIAQRLHVSPATVRTHVRNAMTKLGAHTRAQLVAVAMSGDGHVEITRSVDGSSPESSN
jgi:DNA-binding NarL/FixJ family response regulator